MESFFLFVSGFGDTVGDLIRPAEGLLPGGSKVDACSGTIEDAIDSSGFISVTETDLGFTVGGVDDAHCFFTVVEGNWFHGLSNRN